jgi:hypothetical protein
MLLIYLFFHISICNNYFTIIGALIRKKLSKIYIIIGALYIYIYIYIYTYIYLEMALFMLLLFEGLILLEILGHCLIGPMGELAILANYMYGNFKDVY